VIYLVICPQTSLIVTAEFIWPPLHRIFSLQLMKTAKCPQNSLIVPAEFVWQASQRTVSLYLQNLFGRLAREQSHCTCRICLAS